MILIQIGVPDDAYHELENLAKRSGCDGVPSLIEKALQLMKDAVECIEDDGQLFFRYGDGSLACVRGLAPDSEKPLEDYPPLTPPTNQGSQSGKRSPATTLIEIIKRLGWEGPAIRIIRETNP